MATLTADWNINVSVQNLDGIVANFHAANARVQRGVRRVVGESAARLESRTIDLAPKRTGYMSEHVRTEFTPSGLAYDLGWFAEDFLGTTDEHGHPRAFYPLYVEFGTVHMRAQPSLSIAWAEEEPLFKAELSDELRKAYAG